MPEKVSSASQRSASIVKVSQDRVMLETSSGSIVGMDVDELISELEEGEPLPVVYENAEEEDEDE